MPRTKEANQLIRTEQRKKILDNARSVFALKGWATTMADIAEAAGVSQGLAYRYFPSKDAIFSELTEQIIKSDPIGFQKVLDMDGTPTQRMQTLLSGLLESRHQVMEAFEFNMQLVKARQTSGEYLEFAKKLIQNPQGNDVGSDNLNEVIKQRYRSFYEVIIQLIREGQDNGEFINDDPEKLAFILISCIQGLTANALNEPEKFKNYYPYSEIMMRILK